MKIEKSDQLKNKKVLVIITGSIAAIKTPLFDNMFEKVLRSFFNQVSLSLSKDLENFLT